MTLDARSEPAKIQKYLNVLTRAVQKDSKQ